MSITEKDLEIQKLRKEVQRIRFSNAKLEEELQEYRELDEKGLLLKLPCKIGSLVYEIKKDLNSMKRETIERDGHYYYRNIYVYFITQVTFEIEDISSLGKTVFLTKEEAEAKLKELESE